MVDLTDEQRAELEAEKQKAIEEAVAKKIDELDKKHNSEMANLRLKAKSDQENAVKKAVEDANLTAEEKAKKELEEKSKAQESELAELRAYKKQGELAKKLADKNLPTFFVNDSRLLNASEDKVDEVIATLESDFKKSLPNGGATIDTNLNVGGNGASTKEKFEDVRNLGLTK